MKKVLKYSSAVVAVSAPAIISALNPHAFSMEEYSTAGCRTLGDIMSYNRFRSSLLRTRSPQIQNPGIVRVRSPQLQDPGILRSTSPQIQNIVQDTIITSTQAVMETDDTELVSDLEKQADQILNSSVNHGQEVTRVDENAEQVVVNVQLVSLDSENQDNVNVEYDVVESDCHYSEMEVEE